MQRLDSILAEMGKRVTSQYLSSRDPYDDPKNSIWGAGISASGHIPRRYRGVANGNWLVVVHECGLITVSVSNAPGFQFECFLPRQAMKAMAAATPMGFESQARGPWYALAAKGMLPKYTILDPVWWVKCNSNGEVHIGSVTHPDFHLRFLIPLEAMYGFGRVSMFS